MSELDPSPAAWQQLKARARSLPEATRSELVRHWTRSAQLEHGSVAAFSRFSLQLLAVGAPASLLEETHRAALDEIRHAELCFSLASVYAGSSVGPGPLRVEEHPLAGWDLLSAAVGTVEEGCVGESIAALEAQAARELARDEAVQRVLARIHADESRHAQLAFAFVRWAAETGGAEVVAALRAAFERTLALHRGQGSVARIADFDLEQHGVLSASRKRALRDRILVEVLEPSVCRLFAGASA